MTRYAKPLTPTEMAALDDAEIDFSDQSELDASFWAKARVVMPEDLDARPIGVRSPDVLVAVGIAQDDGQKPSH